MNVILLGNVMYAYADTAKTAENAVNFNSFSVELIYVL